MYLSQLCIDRPGNITVTLTSVQNCMNTASVAYTSRYKSEASAALANRKPYYLGETNSATCGGGGISPTFGAALWIVDYAMQAALNGVQRLYFHQGTIAACPYCWWNGCVYHSDNSSLSVDCHCLVQMSMHLSMALPFFLRPLEQTSPRPFNLTRPPIK